jgi:hypothetical protein
MSSRSSNATKLVFLLLITVAASGSVVYQIRARRAGVRPPAAAQAVQQTPTQEGASPSAAAPSAVATQPGVGQAGAQQAPADIPSDLWGPGGRRNPFLSMEEVADLNRPPSIAIEKPIEAPTPAPPPIEMPAYSVTAIIAGDAGHRAVVGARVLQPGDRLGSETVKEITERSMVLEFEGRTRVLTLRGLQNGIRQIVVPRGD